MMFVVAMEDAADVDAIASGVVMEEQEVADEEVEEPLWYALPSANFSVDIMQSVEHKVQS